MWAIIVYRYISAWENNVICTPTQSLCSAELGVFCVAKNANYGNTFFRSRKLLFGKNFRHHTYFRLPTTTCSVWLNLVVLYDAVRISHELKLVKVKA